MLRLLADGVSVLAGGDRTVMAVNRLLTRAANMTSHGLKRLSGIRRKIGTVFNTLMTRTLGDELRPPCEALLQILRER